MGNSVWKDIESNPEIKLMLTFKAVILKIFPNLSREHIKFNESTIALLEEALSKVVADDAKKIFKLKTGIDNGNIMGYPQTARRYRCSVDEVKEIEKQTIIKLQNFLRYKAHLFYK